VLRSVSIRWRLAAISAGLTFVILCGFATVVGELTSNRIRADFNNQLAAAADDLQGRLVITVDQFNRVVSFSPRLDLYAAPEHAVIRVMTEDGTVIRETPRKAPNFGFPPVGGGTITFGGYRIATRTVQLNPSGTVLVQYARRLSDVDATIHRVRLFLILGVLGGTGLALLGGLMLARRAMAPIASLTTTARDIGRTRDLTRSVPIPEADDEVAELARTLDEMLQALESSRAETEGMLQRQRQFVADASHELRTPLTSVLANLEVLADSLDGEHGEAARSALRSSHRMRRLVSDLLLLARADARRPAPHSPTDVGRVVVEAVAELGPVAGEHEVSVDAQTAVVDGAPDELHRLALNLVENAIRHTPAGTHVQATVERRDGQVLVAVQDDGPGIPPELRERVFERFVRGTGDHGGSFGLGLSIVRAVAESHGGTVELSSPVGPSGGARFVVRLPAAPDGAPVADEDPAVLSANI